MRDGGQPLYACMGAAWWIVVFGTGGPRSWSTELVLLFRVLGTGRDGKVVVRSWSVLVCESVNGFTLCGTDQHRDRALKFGVTRRPRHAAAASNGIVQLLSSLPIEVPAFRIKAD